MANSLAKISGIFGLTGCGRRLFLTQSRSFYAYSAEPFHPVGDRQPKWCSADEAVSVIKSNDKVFLHGGAATPLRLTKAMAEHGKKAGLKNVKMFHIHTEGPGEFAHPDCAGIFRSNSLFIGGNCRVAINEGRADFTPIFLSEIPLLFRRKIVELDVALIHVTPPDKHGNCSMGVSVDCARAAVQNSKYLVGLINPQMPRTFGDGIIHISHFDAVAETDEPLPELKIKPSTPEETAIGQLIAGELVDNGATLQMGIGSVPDAALAAMKNHKDLGVHSEMFSDGVVDLVHCGALTNAKKVIQTGKIVSSFCIGTNKLFDFLRDNPLVVMLEINYTNSTAVICQNPKVTAINSCIEVDLTGQVVSDSIGTRMYSGVGGQVDFIRGAGLSLDGLGKPILALPSQTKKGESKIVPYVKQGSGVVTSRAHVHYIVTEYGIAYLFGKNIRQRAYELIKIAHPNHRESLEKAAFERLKAMPSPD